MKDGWPKHPGHIESARRIMGLLQSRHKSVLDVRDLAMKKIRPKKLSPIVNGPHISVAFIYKALRGAARDTERGKAVRAAVAQLTRRDARWLFLPADRENALIEKRKKNARGKR